MLFLSWLVRLHNITKPSYRTGIASVEPAAFIFKSKRADALARPLSPELKMEPADGFEPTTY